MKSRKSEPSSLPASGPDKEGIFAGLELGCRCHFLDSGSFTLWTKAAEWGAANGRDPYEFYDQPDFYEYADAYAAFVKKHKNAIDYYANVDAIPNPEVTWRNQRYLEKTHGLRPVPVVHYRTPPEWIEKYIKRRNDDGSVRHNLLALGGLVGSTGQEHCKRWLDEAFEVICDQPSRLPRVRVHGFGVTAHPLLFRYPWWSVDSTSWTMVGANGAVLVPEEGKGDEWNFRVPPRVVKFSLKAKEVTLKGKHYDTMTKGEKAVISRWLDELGIPLGVTADDGTIVEYGVRNRHCERKAANLHYYERLRAVIPKYPWPFKGRRVHNLGIKLEGKLGG